MRLAQTEATVADGLYVAFHFEGRRRCTDWVT